jgi:hypothetical protein
MRPVGWSWAGFFRSEIIEIFFSPARKMLRSNEKITDAMWWPGHGGYYLFLDGYHVTYFSSNGGGRGDLIYFVHDWRHGAPGDAAYCYNIQDDKLECAYM